MDVDTTAFVGSAEWCIQGEVSGELAVSEEISLLVVGVFKNAVVRGLCFYLQNRALTIA